MDRPKVLWLLVALAPVLGPASDAEALQAGPEEGPDSTAIRQIWSEVDATWRARDTEGFVRLFTTDVSFALVDRGPWLEGRESLRRHFTEQFGHQRPALQHLTDVTRFYPLAKDIVAVDGEVRIVDGRHDEAVILRRLTIAVVMVETRDGWRIKLLRALTLPATDAGGPG